MDASERRKRASTEAADWFARLQSGQIERSERQQFVEWLRESHIHVVEMLRIAQIHGDLKQFQRWACISTGPKTAEDSVAQLLSLDVNRLQVTSDKMNPRNRKVAVPQRTRAMLFAVAATIVLMVSTAFVLIEIRGQVIETDRGERREVVLSDGSVLQVDPETRLRVKYAGKIRHVFLERGRALFHVAKNTNRPFLVEASNTTVRAVGTAFGVERQTQGVVVTVAEGKVAVSSRGLQSPIYHPLNGSPLNLLPSIALQNLVTERRTKRVGEVASPSPPNEDAERRGEDDSIRLAEIAQDSSRALFLTADQQVTVRSGGAPESVREVDSHRALAWANGRLIFQNDELGKVVAEFNRYSRVQLTVADDDLAAKPVSGVFNASDPEALIAMLQTVTAVEVVRDGERSITIRAARRP